MSGLLLIPISSFPSRMAYKRIYESPCGVCGAKTSDRMLRILSYMKEHKDRAISVPTMYEICEGLKCGEPGIRAYAGHKYQRMIKFMVQHGFVRKESYTESRPKSPLFRNGRRCYVYTITDKGIMTANDPYHIFRNIKKEMVPANDTKNAWKKPTHTCNWLVKK